MIKPDRIVLKPNEQQRQVLEYLKGLLGTADLHGADQKTIYWALEMSANLYHLFAIDKLLQAKGVQVRDPALFKSPAYQNVAQNAKKSTPADGFKGAQTEYVPLKKLSKGA